MKNFSAYYIFDQTTKNVKFDHMSCLNDLLEEINPINLDDTPSFYWNDIYHAYSENAVFEVLYAYGSDNLSALEIMKKVVSNHFKGYKNQFPKISTQDSFIIPFRDVALNVVTGEAIEYSKYVYIKQKLPFEYNPNVDIVFAEDVINRWSNNNASIALLIKEIIGSCLVSSRKLEQCFILLGPQNNGKSTFIEMLENLVGSNNCSFLELKHFTDEKFLILLDGKLVNCGDDIDNSILKDTSAFKKTVTHNMVTGRKLYDSAVTFRPMCTCVFSANVPPEIIDDTGAIDRRLTYVPFEADFSKNSENRINDINTKIRSKEVLQAFSLIGIDALRRLCRQNYEYTSIQGVSIDDTNSIKSNEFYLNEYTKNLSAVDFIGEIPQSKYEEFLIWVYETKNIDLKMDLITFSKFVLKKFNLKTKSARPDGKVARVYCEKIENVNDLRINEETCGQTTEHAIELKEIKYGN